MSELQVEIADDVEIIRVFTRKDSQSWGLDKLNQADFARVMANHSGLSMWRNLSDEEAMRRLPTDKRKGAARIKAKALKDMGLAFFAQTKTAEHLSVRCVGCNFAVDYSKGLCKQKNDSPCGFDIVESPSPTSKILAKRNFFTITTPIN